MIYQPDFVNIQLIIKYSFIIIYILGIPKELSQLVSNVLRIFH